MNKTKPVNMKIVQLIKTSSTLNTNCGLRRPRKQPNNRNPATINNYNTHTSDIGGRYI